MEPVWSTSAWSLLESGCSLTEQFAAASPQHTAAMPAKQRNGRHRRGAPVPLYRDRRLALRSPHASTWVLHTMYNAALFDAAPANTALADTAKCPTQPL